MRCVQGKHRRKQWDAFLSYAGEDRKDVVEPLAQMLTDGGLKIWLGYQELHVGDRLLARINEGMTLSRFGIVLLSPSFFQKSWPKAELDGIFTLDQSGLCKLLPVWHDLALDDVRRHSPMLASRVAAETTDGLPHVATLLFDEIARARKVGVQTRRKRMISIQQCRETYVSGIEFSTKEVADLIGISTKRLYEWHDRRWGGTEGGGSHKTIRYSINNLLVITALHHWTINGVKVDDRIAGLTFYAVRAARVPFILICVTGQRPAVFTAEPEDILEALTGTPASVIYDPEKLLLEIFRLYFPRFQPPLPLAIGERIGDVAPNVPADLGRLF